MNAHHTAESVIYPGNLSVPASEALWSGERWISYTDQSSLSDVIEALWEQDGRTALSIASEVMVEQHGVRADAIFTRGPHPMDMTDRWSVWVRLVSNEEILADLTAKYGPTLRAIQAKDGSDGPSDEWQEAVFEIEITPRIAAALEALLSDEDKSAGASDSGAGEDWTPEEARHEVLRWALAHRLCGAEGAV